MRGLGPDARLLIDAAGDGDGPTADDAARVRAKVAKRLAVAAATGVAATVATKASAGASSAVNAGVGAGAAVGTGALASAGSAGIVAKVFLAVALAGGTAATGAVVLQRAAPPIMSNAVFVGVVTKPSSEPTLVTPPPPQPLVEQVPSPSASARTPLASPRPSPTPGPDRRTPSVSAPSDVVSPAASAAVAEPQPSEIAPAASAAAPAAASAATSSATPVTAPDSITDEVRLLRAAHAAFARGDGAGSLSLLDEHAARFPHGALAEERQAARVFALCASGRTADARAAASSFIAASPRSPHAEQVRKSCATPSGRSPD